MIPSSKPKPPTSSACIYARRSTRPCSASMRRPPFKPWIVSIPSYRSRRDAPNATASSTTATARSPCMRRSIPPLAASTAKPPPATPAASSSPFSKRWSPCARLGNRFTSSSTISPRTKLRRSASSSHTSREFVAFLQEVVALCPPRQQIHIILDNLSAHKTQAVREFLQQHPRVRFHFTPAYSSWLNQVEIWFAKIEREVIARGIFTSVSDLARKLRRYINAYSANARPIQWKYSDPTRRIRSNELTATGH